MTEQEFAEQMERTAWLNSLERNEWQPIDAAPRDGSEITVRGEAGPYGVTSWEGRAKWGTPPNWHRDHSTWLSPKGAVMRLAGYVPTQWKPE